LELIPLNLWYGTDGFLSIFRLLNSTFMLLDRLDIYGTLFLLIPLNLLGLTAFLPPQWIWLSGSLLLNLKERNTKEESLR